MYKLPIYIFIFSFEISSDEKKIVGDKVVNK